MFKQTFGSLPLWKAVLVVGTVVAATIWLIGYFNQPKKVQ